jgi:hypothetical protein
LSNSDFFFRQLNYCQHINAYKVQQLALKTLLVEPNNQGSPGMDWDQHSCLSASGKATGHFYLFFFSWKKQRPVEQTELDSATCITTKEMVYKLKRLPTQ